MLQARIGCRQAPRPSLGPPMDPGEPGAAATTTCCCGDGLASFDSGGADTNLNDLFEDPSHFRLGRAARSMAAELKNREEDSSTNASLKGFSSISKRHAPWQFI